MGVIRSQFTPQQKHWIGQLMAVLTYRKGWEIGHEYDNIPAWGNEVLVLHLRAPAEDTWHKLEAAEIRVSRAIPGAWAWPQDDRASFITALLREVHAMITNLEAHERLEWLQINGEPAWDPHPHGGSANRPLGHARTQYVPEDATPAPDLIWDHYTESPYLFGLPLPTGRAGLRARH